MSMTEWWNDPRYAEQPSTVPTSKVDEFKKQNKDNTKVGKVEQAIVPKVAGAIEAGKKGKLGFLINPAMRVMETVGERIVQPLTQGVSTALLTPQAAAAKKGSNLVENFRFAKKQSEKISMGQALAGGVGKVVSPVLGGTNATFLDEDFNIFDDKQRDKAFRDEWIGIVASGATDLALAAIGSKGMGTAVRAGTKRAIGPKRIVTTDDMNKFRDNLNQIVEEVESGVPVEARTRNGLSVLVDDLVNTKKATDLSANPLINETSNPYRTATIVSRLDNHRDVADYLLAERGDVDAFNRFFAKKPLEADHIDDYGFDKTTPITDFSDIGTDLLTPKLEARFQRILDAKKEKDPKLARALDEFATNVPRGVGIESYQPGRFAALESAGLAKKKLGIQAQFGDLKLFGDDGSSNWKTEVYQSNTYDRVIRTIAWVGSGRPQGHINISNPRKFEAASDLLSDLNRLQFLGGAKGATFKRRMVEQFLNAQDDTQRAQALGRIEEQVMVRLAKEYGVTDMQDIRSAAGAVKEITRWRAKTNENRATIQQFAAKNGWVPAEDGSINVQNFISVANEAQTIPMLDFRKLEVEVITNARRMAGKGTKVTDAQYYGARASKVAMNTGQLLDLANMVFSNLNLIRLAYIPKNSMVDPFARATMALESMELVRNGAPAIDNFMYNSSLRGESLRKFIPGTPQAAARKKAKQAQFEVEKFRAELEPNVAKWEKAQALSDEAEKVFKKAEKARNAALTRANKTPGSAKAQSALYAAEDVLYDARVALNNAGDELNRAADLVNIHAKLIDKTRQEWAGYASSQMELRTGKKGLGKEEEVITSSSGKEYTIQGLADPNIRGASAYMSEIDSAQNFYSTSMQSEISKKLRADGTRFVKIERKDRAEYMNALAHIANRQIRNELDMPVGMMMRGDSPTDILAWLYSPAGKEYRLRMGSRFNKDLTKDDLASWITQTTDKLNKMYPDPELRKIILTRDVSVDEVDAMLYGRPDLPETIDGPNIRLDDLNAMERGLVKVGAATDAAWKVLSAAENRLVRTPLFLSYTRAEMKVLIDSAERAGIDVADAVVNHELRQIAYRKALTRVEETLYSSRRLTNGMYVSRYAMSFPLAFFNSQVVALRLMARNPMNAYWYNSIQTAFDNFEAYEDKDGNTYKSLADVPKGTQVSVSYPIPGGKNLPGWAKTALKPFSDSRGGGVRWNPKQLEFMVADPSVSWFGTVLVSELVKGGFMENTPWGVHGETIATGLRDLLGDDVYESSVLYGGYPQEGGGYVGTALQAIMPGYMSSLLDAVYALRDGGKISPGASDRYIDDVYTHWRVGYSEWDKNGRVGEPPTMPKAAKSAAAMAFIRAIVQFSAPIATSFDPVTRSATAYYADLVDAANGDYKAAEQVFIEEWGIDGLSLIGSNQKNVAGVAATMNDVKMLRKNTELLASVGRYNTKYAAMLSSGYGDIAGSGSGKDDYSTEVAAIYKRLNFPGDFNNPITQKKTSDELKKGVEARRGWAESQKAQEWRDAKMYEYGISSTASAAYERSGIKREYDKMIAEVEQDFPGWVQERDENRQDYWSGLIPSIEKIVDDTKWRAHAISQGSPKWEEISYWVAEAKRFNTAYEEQNNTAARKLRLKQNFAQFHYDFIQTSSDEFAAFAYKWLNNMPQLSTEFVGANGN